jgi:hypothetical protein
MSGHVMCGFTRVLGADGLLSAGLFVFISQTFDSPGRGGRRQEKGMQRPPEHFVGAGEAHILFFVDRCTYLKYCEIG